MYIPAYQPNFSRIVKRKLDLAKMKGGKAKVRFLEIGLGCAPGGGMIAGKPGGSAKAWRRMFDKVPGLELDLHVMEFDGTSFVQSGLYICVSVL